MSTRVIAASLVLMGSAISAQQGPMFRAATELVRVDVLVVRDGRPVTGLQADAFEVRDNGIRQRVAAVHALDGVRLSLVLDASGSMEGERLGRALDASHTLLDRLDTDDRFVVLAFGNQVAVLADSTLPRAEIVSRFSHLRANGSTALVDAAYAGIVQGDVASGPKLLLLMTDGRNNMSWLQAQAAIETARRHETVIYPVVVGLSRRSAEWSGPRGVLERSVANDGVELLRIMANETGGRVVEAEWTSDLRAVFGEILNEYRQRYILTFTPEGVGRNDGWHRLEVKLRRGRGTVRARNSYWAGGTNQQVR